MIRSVRQEPRAQAALEIVEEHTASGQEARRQDAGENRRVLLGEFDRLVDGARGGAHRQRRVPHPELNALGHRCHVRREFILIEEEQIHVRVDVHLAARVAAHRHHAQPRLALATAPEVDLLGELEQAPDQPIHQVRARFVHALARAPRAVQLLEVGLGPDEVLAHDARHPARVPHPLAGGREVVVDRGRVHQLRLLPARRVCCFPR